MLGHREVDAEEGGQCDERVIDARVAAVLEMTQLEAQSRELAGSLSYGGEKMLGVAMALMCAPSMLLLDEPGSGLSHDELDRLSDVLRRLRGQVFACAVEVDECYDVPRFHNIHIWPYWSGANEVVRWQQNNGDAMVFRRSDGREFGTADFGPQINRQIWPSLSDADKERLEWLAKNRDVQVPSFTGCANKCEGVFESLNMITRMLLHKFINEGARKAA